MRSAATPIRVDAELYRANPIESADTTALRARTAEGVEIVFIASHACNAKRGPVIRLECADGEVTVDRGDVPDKDWQLRRKPACAKRPGEGSSELSDRIQVMSAWGEPFQHVARILQGAQGLPVCTLAMARPHCLVVNGAHLSSPIHAIPSTLCSSVTRTENSGQPQIYRVVKGMNDCLNVCFEKGCLPSGSGVAAWAQPGKPVDVSQLTFFSMPK